MNTTITSPPVYKQFRGGLTVLQLVFLCGIGFMSVIAVPRQLLWQATIAVNVPVEFIIVSVSLPDICIILALVITVLRIVTEPDYRQRLFKYAYRLVIAQHGYLWIALLLWTLISRVWAIAAPLSQANGFQLGLCLLFALILAERLYQSEGRILNVLLCAILVSACLQATVGVLQSLNNGPLGWSDWGEPARFPYEVTGYYRARGLSMHPNYLGGYLMIALFSSLMLYVTSGRNRVLRVFTGFAGVISVIGLIACLSRSAFLSTAAGIAVLVGFQFRALLRYKWLVLAGSILAGILVTAIFTLALRGDFRNFQERFFQPREFFLQNSLEVIQQHPLQGAGAGNLIMAIIASHGTLEPNLLPVHNVYLYIWAELGIVGVSLFVLALGSVIRLARLTVAPSSQIWLALLVAVSMVMLFDNYLWAVLPMRTLLFWCIGIGYGLFDYRVVMHK